MAEFIRGHHSWWWVYYFSAQGIERVQIFSFRKALGIVMLSALAASILIAIIVVSGVGLQYPALTVTALLLLMALAICSPLLFQSFRVRGLLQLDITEVARKYPAKTIQWSDVVSVAVNDGLMILTTKGATYRIFMDDSDEKVGAFLEPFAGDVIT